MRGIGSIRNNEMSMAHRAGSSVVRAMVCRLEGPGFDSRLVHFVHCQSSSAECDTWRRGKNPLAESVLVGMRFVENSREI